jgi:AcrR family transcriptional regulator
MARNADPTKKARIISAAALVFAQKGYTGTLMAQVAQAAGIGKGTIYEYFKSKEDLFFAVFEHIMAESGEQMAAAAGKPNGSTANRLGLMATALIQTWMAKLDLYALVMEFWSATTALTCRQRFKAAFKAGYADFRQLIARLIQKGIDDGEFISGIDPQKIAAALIGSWDALLLQAWLDPEFDPLAASQEHMQVLLRGMTRTLAKEQ